ncbi:hypothetical protein [Aquabacterium sp.]|uniref:hypothetical protein n=1 Tax=Aquabacterium sp. TaxID=1872578 RepID=UPI002C94BB56|nr:hypothetical protein [Aquabacterium sp.]HSW04440.1 hypothetical protein [Aquabacterium sp.]
MSSRPHPADRFLIGALTMSSLLTSAIAALTLHVETPLSQPAATPPHGTVQQQQQPNEHSATLASVSRGQPVRQ